MEREPAMVSKILDRQILEDLVRKCLEMEKVSETSDIWRIYEATENTQVKGLLFDLKVESEHHLHVLIDVADEIGMEVDEGRLERKAEENSLLKEGMDLRDVLTQLKRHDQNCQDFYGRISDSLSRSAIDGLDEETVEQVAERFRYLSDYEERHIEKLADEIRNMEAPL